MFTDFLWRQKTIFQIAAVSHLVVFASSTALGLPILFELAPVEVNVLGRSIVHCNHLPGSDRLLIQCDSKPPELWDTRLGKQIAVLDETNTISASIVTSDGRLFFTADAINLPRRPTNRVCERSVRAWESKTGRLIKTFDLDLTQLDLLCATDWSFFFADEKTVGIELTCRRNLWRLSSGSYLVRFNMKNHGEIAVSPYYKFGERLVPSPDRSRAIGGLGYGVYRQSNGELDLSQTSGTRSYSTCLVDLVKQTIISKLDNNNSDINTATWVIWGFWSPDGTRVVTIDSENSISIWDGFSGKRLQRLVGHASWVLRARFSADGQTLVSASDDRTARVWDVGAGKEMMRFVGHSRGLNDATFDPGMKHIVTCADDQSARLWDVKSGKLLRVFNTHEGKVRSVDFLDNGQTVLTETAEGWMQTWSVKEGRQTSIAKSATSIQQYGNCLLKVTEKLVELEYWAKGADSARRMLIERKAMKPEDK